MRNKIIRTLKPEWPAAVMLSASFLLFAILVRHIALPGFLEFLKLKSETAAISALTEGENGKNSLRHVIQSKRKSLEEKQAGIRNLYGSAQNLPDLLKLVFNYAAMDSVNIERAQPQNEADDSKSGDYELVLEASGQYRCLSAFVSRLEEMPHILRIRRMSIDTEQRGGISMKLLLNCYFTKKTEP
jgi:Tfp pilus assembly protein PilO